jgi:hypothetical protein
VTFGREGKSQRKIKDENRLSNEQMMMMMMKRKIRKSL